jgi:hypothetical protein
MWSKLSWWEKLKWHLADLRDDFGMLPEVVGRALVAGIILFVAAAASGIVAGVFRLVRVWALGG